MTAGSRVLVVGAGPAGVRAAETLAAAGLRPLVIDEGQRAGGQIYRRPPPGFSRPPKALYGFEAVKALAVHAAFDRLEGQIDYWPGSLVWNLERGVATVLRDERHHRVPYDAVILATGAMDRVVPFPGWTTPGVFTLGGAQVALKYQGCAIGRRVAFVGTGPLLYLVAWQYAKAGAEVVAVLDTAPPRGKVKALPHLLTRPTMLAKGLFYLGALRARGVPLQSSATPLRAEGAERVTALHVRVGGQERRVECDAIGFGYGLKPETQLADLAEVQFAFDELERLWLPRSDAAGRTSVPGVYLAGDGAGILGAEAAELAGERAARALLLDRGEQGQEEKIASLSRRLRRYRRFRKGLETAFPFPSHLAASLPDELCLCRCEAVSAGALREAANSLEARELNRAKAFTRVGMGRCQGRICGPAAAEVLAAATGQPVEAVGRLRGQPPVKPVPMVPLADQDLEAAS